MVYIPPSPNGPADPASPTEANSQSKVFSEGHASDYGQNTTRRHFAYSEPLPPVPASRWGKIRLAIRDPAAEFIGVAILVMFGCAGSCQAVTSTNPGVASTQQGSYFSIALGWGFGLALGGWVSVGVSGGHINPAVTLAMATFRGFPWRKVPGYVFAQLMGGIFGAALVYANYYHAINIYEGGHYRTLSTARFFGTYALDYLPNAAAFFDEFLGCFILMLVILAATDKRNSPPPGLFPLALFLTLFGLGVCFGMQTGFAVNPARDLGPRILTAIAGWGKQVFTYRNQYWLWAGVLAPIFGAQIAAMLYDTFIYDSQDSCINRAFMKVPSRRTQGNAANSTMV
ncbi:aquaporin [Guyanagaster necrorhizus]|uniref:Aquaporin n=1 Tax=Guyanagaster necrorhizus TaxID=856835 RepID=A0A9P7VLD8_9AGAR|nr:aquaporin [Guyanagaster necrorhizus MCA 3950]KAG7442839.1 aquaporin [Guyanagaster necrorhizus MCA 3950]